MGRQRMHGEVYTQQAGLSGVLLLTSNCLGIEPRVYGQHQKTVHMHFEQS
jgi:hypothetical protein